MNQSDVNILRLTPFSISRRSFLGKAALSVGALATGPSWGYPINDQVRVAIIGMGNRGGSAVEDVFRTQGVKLVAICDPDRKRIGKHEAEDCCGPR